MDAGEHVEPGEDEVTESTARTVAQYAAEFNVDACDLPTRAALVILIDITDRRGFRQTWDGVDDDIQREIVEAWIAAIREVHP